MGLYTAWGIDSFNPRSHEGSDGIVIKGFKIVEGFNPRSHEGSDCNDVSVYAIFRVSIHAPMKGATNNICFRLLLP